MNDFAYYREHIVGHRHRFNSPYGPQQLLYADWAASGRLYEPIETVLLRDFGPYAANTHSQSNITGGTMTLAYEEAKRIIKQHVRAGEHDIILFAGTGMTGAVNKLQRLLGLKLPAPLHSVVPVSQRPVIFITHMEHHSNQISWSETIGDVICLPPAPDGSVDPSCLERLARQYAGRPLIGAFTACSNVTGFETPYTELAEILHRYGGLCFIDFSASAPYTTIDMHPAESPLGWLDGIVFSPHKFLGGPGTSGVLVMNARLLHQGRVPDHPGGGTVLWTDPWGGWIYNGHAESREDGGTPGVMQAIRTALCIRLKEEMGIPLIQERERKLTSLLLRQLSDIPEVTILGGEERRRLGIVSFLAQSVPYALMVKLLNDRFGIQVRGGCSCAGTYGHYLLGIGPEPSKQMAETILCGDLTSKPGWVRVSIHPTMTEQEMAYIGYAVRTCIRYCSSWKRDYAVDVQSGEWHHRNDSAAIKPELHSWFDLSRLTQCLKG
ncbi:aminotransferase class V-fold PLP-dependent enzyme [Paenibacillus antibioticophila]|uniref:aminotransferase class V-fold PLP-dependent enzyme n=1 Tax=Paenibacillus antibioticophila TaxID=1274374 RepID=UPI0005CACD1E|nr:aminotransferase class V-fold PLP-dependent enzyme [Paenibacillus antibioticophila]